MPHCFTDEFVSGANKDKDLAKAIRRSDQQVLALLAGGLIRRPCDKLPA